MEKPPDKIVIFSLLVILLIWLYIVGSIATNHLNYLFTLKEPIDAHYEGCMAFTEESYTLIQKNSLVSVSSPYYIRPSILASLTLDNLLSEIIRCESGGNPKAKNPKSTAYGLCQFLDGTWEYIQKKWDMKLDRDNPEDQLYACERLLKEEGLRHWKPVWECIGYNEKCDNPELLKND